MDVLVLWSRDPDVTMQKLVRSGSKKVLQNTQKTVLSRSLDMLIRVLFEINISKVIQPQLQKGLFVSLKEASF